MWSEYTNVNQQVPWGTYINDLEQEASLVLNQEPYVALLDCMAVIRVSGEEAGTFLQGQVTCDVVKLGDQEAVLGAHCNAKGGAGAATEQHAGVPTPRVGASAAIWVGARW